MRSDKWNETVDGTSVSIEVSTRDGPSFYFRALLIKLNNTHDDRFNLSGLSPFDQFQVPS